MLLLLTTLLLSFLTITSPRCCRPRLRHNIDVVIRDHAAMSVLSLLTRLRHDVVIADKVATREAISGRFGPCKGPRHSGLGSAAAAGCVEAGSGRSGRNSRGPRDHPRGCCRRPTVIRHSHRAQSTWRAICGRGRAAPPPIASCGRPPEVPDRTRFAIEKWTFEDVHDRARCLHRFVAPALIMPIFPCPMSANAACDVATRPLFRSMKP